MCIRELRDGDKDKLVEMYETFSSAERTLGLPPEGDELFEWVEDITSKGMSLVAEVDGKLVGHLALVPDGRALHLLIFVRRDYQNRGIGTKLLSFAVNNLVSNPEYERVVVTTDLNNDKAIRILQKTGFQLKVADMECELHLPLMY
jgi:ribosomal protein S18 acetylase RimI-like enzyme